MSRANTFVWGVAGRLLTRYPLEGTRVAALRSPSPACCPLRSAEFKTLQSTARRKEQNQFANAKRCRKMRGRQSKAGESKVAVKQEVHAIVGA